jgi:hypothetical protein
MNTDPEKSDEHRRLAIEIRRQNIQRRKDAGNPSVREQVPIDIEGELPKVPEVEPTTAGKEAGAEDMHRIGQGPAPQEKLPASGEDTGFVTIVTGLPRSGTSMMMQMLKAGGLDPLTDERREADEDNPRGYFELQAATQLRDHPDLHRGLDQAATGRARADTSSRITGLEKSSDRARVIP